MVIYENRLMSLRQNQTETLGDAQFHEKKESKNQKSKIGKQNHKNFVKLKLLEMRAI